MDFGVVKLVVLGVIVLAVVVLAVNIGRGLRTTVRTRRLSRRARVGLLVQAWVLGLLTVALAVILVLIVTP